MDEKILKVEKEVEQVFTTYKLNLARLMRKGFSSQVVSILNDSGVINDNEYSFYDIAKKAENIATSEETQINRVNFVFSLLSKEEREVIAHEYLFISSHIWWTNKYSRSTFYRLRKSACKKFMTYYG